MAVKETYTIEAGVSERPETLLRGNIEKKTGQTVLVGDPALTLNKRADIGIPNVTSAWGVRLDKDGKVPEMPLDIKDSQYRGQIKELKWGSPEGCLILCRYMKGYNSIDLLYQDTVLNAAANINKDDPASADAYYITLQSGDNVFDPETDRYLTQMLRVHYLNGSSVSRHPDSSQQMFVEKNYAEEEQKGVKTYNAKFDAMKIVKVASEDNSLAKMKNLLSIVEAIGTEEPKDNDLFRYLSFLADTKYDLFLGRIEEYKKTVSNIFEKAKSYKALDLTKDGVIVAGKDKMEIIGEGIPAKKEGMLDWVLQNYLDAKAADVIFKLTQITDKLN
jgi:hypothetical protein